MSANAVAWTKFGVRRLANLCGALFILSSITALMLDLVPGDPARSLAGLNASPAYVEQLRENLGLNEPMLSRYVTYLGNALSGDLGTSFVDGQPVLQIINDRLPETIWLALASMVLVVAIGIPGGIVAGALTQEGRRKPLERSLVGVTGLAQSIPHFIAAAFLVAIFAVYLGWFPAAGSGGITAVILPAISLAIAPCAAVIRIVRLETINVLRQDYIRTAKSKRLSSRVVYLRHALPNLIRPAIALGGLIFAGLLGGSVVVEQVFNWDGLGSAAAEAIDARNYPVIQGVFLLFGAFVLILNTAVDVILAMVDPRSIIQEN